MQYVIVLGENGLGGALRFFQESADFLVNGRNRIWADVRAAGDASQQISWCGSIAYRAQTRGHAEFRHHASGHFRGAFQIVGGACGGFTED